MPGKEFLGLIGSFLEVLLNIFPSEIITEIPVRINQPVLEHNTIVVTVSSLVIQSR